MALKEQILDDIKTFMKEKNSVALNAVRMLKSEIKNAEIAEVAKDKTKKPGELAIKELDDAGIIKVVIANIKKRRESAEIYLQNGRQELADKENEEIKVLERYLPPQLTDDEIISIIKDIIAGLADNEKKNFGIVMKTTMAKVGSQAEGKHVSELIKGII